jgi:cytochrome c553
MKRWTLRAGLSAGLLLLVMATARCGSASGAAISGRDLYGSCESCHGPTAGGNASFDAPAIAGMPAWYLSSQLQRFQHGTRGKHPDDVEGLRMRAMSMQMLSDAEIQAVAEYVAGLPRAPKAAPSLGGDPAAGQPFYAVCTACHGPAGEGNQTMNAPPIANLEDWYVARQLRKFQTGVRGRVSDDIIGMQMVGMAMTVPADAVDDVAAYVHGLSK